MKSSPSLTWAFVLYLAGLSAVGFVDLLLHSVLAMIARAIAL